MTVHFSFPLKLYRFHHFQAHPGEVILKSSGQPLEIVALLPSCGLFRALTVSSMVFQTHYSEVSIIADSQKPSFSSILDLVLPSSFCSPSMK